MNGQIIPAILPKNFLNLESEVLRAARLADRVQVDLCDGVFVTGVTWPFSEISKADFQNLGKSEKEDLYLPAWEELEFSADLMLSDPLSYIDTLMKYGFDDVVIHFRSLPINTDETKKYFTEICDKCAEYEMSVNLAVDVKTDLPQFKKFLLNFKDRINYVQVMGIEEIGRQGEEFTDKAIDIIKDLKSFFEKENIDLPIFVDGGMNQKSIPLCKEAGAEVFIVGSVLSKAIDYKDEFNFLNSL